ncbi:MAG: hypothetical protein WC600_03950 [Desulfobaccales bacterium]
MAIVQGHGEGFERSSTPFEVGQLQARLARLHHLTPGDFAVMKRKSLMHEKKPNAEQLLSWLKQEVAAKPGLRKGLVGF